MPDPQKQGCCCDACMSGMKTGHSTMQEILERQGRPHSEIETDERDACTCSDNDLIGLTPSKDCAYHFPKSPEIETLIEEFERKWVSRTRFGKNTHGRFIDWFRSALERIRTTAREEAMHSMSEQMVETAKLSRLEGREAERNIVTSLKEINLFQAGREAEQKRILALFDGVGRSPADTVVLRRLRSLITNRDHE